MKKFSIITINYNNCDGLRKTIESVVNQTYIDFEYIIIDGGSTDGSVEVIRDYADRIDYWVSEPDKGIYNAMNKGILKATGEYLNFMNSGDCFDALDVLQKLATRNYVADVITGRRLTIDKKPWLIDSGKDGISMSVFYNRTIGHQSSFIKKQIFNKYMYDENYKIVSDWKFFIQVLILENCSFQFVDLVIADIEIEGISHTNEKLGKMEREKVLSEFFPPRVLSDYEMMKNIEGSPLLESVVFLNKNSTRFQIIIAKMLRVIIKVYSCFVRRKN